MAGTNNLKSVQSRIALWGMGRVYQKYEKTLRDMQEKGDIEIVAIADSNPSGGISGIGAPIVHPRELFAFDFQYLLVTNRNRFDEIIQQATTDFGIDSKRILSYEILRFPGFSFSRYQELRAISPSILSNNYWGTTVFRALNMEACSPFAGMRVREHDFLRLLAELDAYLDEPSLDIRGWRFDAYGRRYLTAVVGDVWLRFFEPHNEETAVATWREGCKSINRQFTIAQMCTLDPACERYFDILKGFSRKICFVPYKTDCLSSVQIPLTSGDRVFEISVENTIEREPQKVPYDVLSLFLCQHQAEGRSFD